MTGGTVTMIAVRRFDPETAQQPRWATYVLAMERHQTVLDALLTISETIDPSLAFRRMCRSGICGSCAGRANGNPVLFCEAHVGDVAARGGVPPGVEAEIAIEPLAGFEVLKDLVVDMEPFFEGLARVEPWLVPNERFDGLMSRADARRMWGAATCVLCGICATGARSTGANPHPAAVAHLLRFVRDPRDARGEARLASLDRPERYNQRFAEGLKAVCPKDVDIAPLLSD
jgi:succinate dehydrogenase / fumarate reductase iron-sulfur subunit